MPFAEKEKVDFRILLTDTDSLYIEWDFTNSKFNSYYEFIQELSEESQIFDMHSFSFGDKSRKKEVGLFLDEEGDSYQIMALIGLCSKSYCYIKKNLKTELFNYSQRKRSF
jgi:DNA polymerase elongation subunit (family B)